MQCLFFLACVFTLVRAPVGVRFRWPFVKIAPFAVCVRRCFGGNRLARAGGGNEHIGSNLVPLGNHLLQTFGLLGSEVVPLGAIIT